MTPGARRILQEMTNGSDLIREGIHAYCGDRRVASRCVTELVWISAISEVAPSESGAKYYSISSMGERYLRRPELEQEYVTWVRCQKGSFTIKNDRIVPIK